MSEQPPPDNVYTAGGRRQPILILTILLIVSSLGLIGVSMWLRYSAGKTSADRVVVLQDELSAKTSYRSWLLTDYISRGAARPNRAGADAQAVSRALSELVSADPESVKARIWYAAFLGEIGREKEAALQISQARRRLKSPPKNEARSLAALHRLYDPAAAFGAPDDLKAISDLRQTIDLDVFGPLITREVHERLGEEARARKIAGEEGLAAVAWFTKLLITVGLGLLAVLAGVVLGIVHAVVTSGLRRQSGLPRKRLPSAKLGAVLMVFIVLTLGVPLAAKFAVGLATGTEPGQLPARFIVTWAIGEEIVIAAFCIWIASGILAGSGLTLRDIGLKVGSGARNVLRGIGGYLVALPIMIGAGLIGYLLFVKMFHVESPANPMLDLVAAAHDRWVLIGAFVLGSVLAPVIEEIFFRGVLQGILRAKVGAWGGIFGSSAVFAGLHPQLPVGFLPLFGIGCVLAYLYEMTDSLVPSMVAHSLNNTMVTVFFLQILA